MDILSTAITKVIEQGKRSVNEDGACRYRSGDLKCAVGHLIKDEHYNPNLEGCGVFGLSVRHAVEQSIDRHLSDKEVNQLSRLQTCHDGAKGKDFVSAFNANVTREIAFGRLPKELLKCL